MFRYRKNYKNMLKSGAKEGCALCDVSDHGIITETSHATVIKNKFPYDIWEHRKVVEHLLIVPKVHAKGLSDLPQAAQTAIFDLIRTYEAIGYDVYARSVGSNMRSITDHQHTHLIKTTGNCANISLYVNKPYLVAKV